MSPAFTVRWKHKFSTHIWKFDQGPLANLPILIVSHHPNYGKIGSIAYVMDRLDDGRPVMTPPGEEPYTPFGETLNSTQARHAEQFAQSQLEQALQCWEKKFGPIRTKQPKPRRSDLPADNVSSFEMRENGDENDYILRVHIPDHLPMHAHVFSVDKVTGERTHQTRFKFARIGQDLHIMPFPYKPMSDGTYREGEEPMPPELIPGALEFAAKNADFIEKHWVALHPELPPEQMIYSIPQPLPQGHVSRLLTKAATQPVAGLG